MNFISLTETRIGARHQEDSITLYDVTKRCVDIAGAGFLLAALSPVMASVALGVKMTSPGPILYGQTRLTQGGETFRLLKFRSMRVDAEADSGAVLATRADPRVTSIGSFLRKTA
jgi:lipopolysaccharide/colanic/teichoic acid biosynthesis glycosyltransferase